MSTETFNIVFSQYPEEMQISKATRPIWFHKSEGDAIPKYITNSIGSDSKYYYDHDGWVCSHETKEKLIRNKKTAGKPKMQKISGQAIWNGAINRYSRNDMKSFLTDYFGPSITRSWPASIFCRPGKYFHFEFIFYFPLTLRNAISQDIDNHSYPYTKSFIDTLQKLEIIPNDSPDYYRGFYCRYVDIPTEEDRRLEVKLHFCDNNERLC